MFTRNRSHYRHHGQPPHSVKDSLDHGIQYGTARRSMGPPFHYPPQPVEIEPGSYPRIQGSHSSWEAAMYPASSVGVPDPSITGIGTPHRIGPMALDLGLRNSSQDSLSTWYNSSDSPWVARGAVPDPTPEDRMQSRGYSMGSRPPSLGHPFGGSNRFVNTSDQGIHFRVPPSDSGYGTILGPESASVRGSEAHDRSPDSQSIAGRVPEIQQYHESGILHEAREAVQWSMVPQNPTMLRCDICQKLARTRSELKKHKLRHTKPFRCSNVSCTRGDGFSTSNDLERHVMCKHPNDLPEDHDAKTYHCLVNGCKSSGKTWRRLDNFKSHLKRVHKCRNESVLETYVHRALMDRRINRGHFLHGKAIEGTKEADQEGRMIEGPDDYPPLPWDNDPDWTENGLAISRQDMLDPALEIPSLHDLAPTSGECLIGIGGAQEQANCLQNTAPDLIDGCLEKQAKLASTNVIEHDVTSRNNLCQGSPRGSPPPEAHLDKDKTPKEPTESRIDPCLREAIAAALSSASIAKDVGLQPGCKSLTENSELPTARVAKVVSCGTAGALPLPSLADALAGSPVNRKPGSDISGAAPCSKVDITDHSLNLLLDAFKSAGYIIKKDNQPAAGSSPTGDHTKSSAPKKRDEVTCTICRQFRGRPCELKKHMKRHNRPYGCTYRDCKKHFGSKNDWKRHENSQHYQHESWLCDERGEDGNSCGKVFYTADNARAHFIKIHKVNDVEAGQKLDQRHIGPNNLELFYCGFCEKHIDQTEMGLDAWNLRFNHIDDHFMGRNGQRQQSIAEWKPNLEQTHSSPKSSPSNDEEGGSDSSSDSSPSSNNSTDSRDTSPPRKNEAKRRRQSSSDEPPERPAKQAKHGKHELRIFCCDCNLDFNPRTQDTCPDDGHAFCGDCKKKKVLVHGDDGRDKR